MLERDLRAAIDDLKRNPPQIQIPLKVELVKPPEGMPTGIPHAGETPQAPPDPLTRGYYWSDSSPHWYLLKEFANPLTLDYFGAGKGGIEKGLNEPMTSAIASFMRSGLLEKVEMHLTDWLVYLYQKKDIVAMCADLGIEERTGTKDDLARQLWECDPDYVRRKAKTDPHYQLTEAGLRATAARFDNKILRERVRRLEAGED